MAAITSVTNNQVTPNAGTLFRFLTTPATADSGDTVDVGDTTVMGTGTMSAVSFVVAFDQFDSTVVTATVSGTVITIDAGGATTNHTYTLMVAGSA